MQKSYSIGQLATESGCKVQTLRYYEEIAVIPTPSRNADINMTRGNAKLDLSNLPSVVFTDPQVANVGLTVDEAQQ